MTRSLACLQLTQCTRARLDGLRPKPFIKDELIERLERITAGDVLEHAERILTACDGE